MVKKENSIKSRYNGLKFIWHPEKLANLRDGIISAPINVRVKPTNRCDHDCFYCSYHPESGNILSKNFKVGDEILKEKMMEILEDFSEMGVKAMVYSGGGEPLIYPHITDALKKTLEYGISLGIITNGQNLNGEKAEILGESNWTRVSLDSSNSETFVKSRRRVSKKMFGQLEENIRNFAKIKNPACELGVNFVVHHLNQNEVYDSTKFFKELGVNHIKFTPRWIDEKGKWLKYHAPFKDNVTKQIARAKEDFPDENFAIFDTYKNDFELTGVPERTYSWCPIMQTVPVIGADSNVYFCHDKTYTDDGLLGSIKDRSFKELWFSGDAEEKFKKFNPKQECKQHCTYDSRNILATDAIRAYNSRHVNFP